MDNKTIDKHIKLKYPIYTDLNHIKEEFKSETNIFLSNNKLIQIAIKHFLDDLKFKSDSEKQEIIKKYYKEILF